MRYMGLDLGTKTLGVALSDKEGIIASAYKVIHFKEGTYKEALDELLDIIKDYNVGGIALGLPKNMNNTCGEAAKRSMDFKEMLESVTDVPIKLIDERLTTVEANNMLLSTDMSRGKRKKVIDALSAQIILDTYLKMEVNK